MAAQDIPTNPKPTASIGEPSQSSAIQSINHDIDRLKTEEDRWNSRYILLLGLSILVAAATLFAQFKTIRTGKALSDKQSSLDAEKDRQLRSELSSRDVRIAELKTASERSEADLAKSSVRLKEAEAEIAKAHVESSDAVARAKGAEAQVAEAKRGAAEASAKAEGFRLDIARANERAAQANRIAEEEKLARVKIEEKLADRAISDASAVAIIERVKEFKGREFQIIPYWDDREPLATAQRLADILVTAGWKLDQPKTWSGLMGGLTGIQVWFHPEASKEAARAAETLVSVLNSLGLSAVLKQQNDPGHPNERIAISVGTKPR